MNIMDTNKRWVNVLRRTENGFVEFEFFVSDVDLCIELILPEAAFKEFCLNNRIVVEKSITSAGKEQHNGLLKLVK
jgi:phenol/toluene 2-monooxygenase (NADH) P0/A0